MRPNVYATPFSASASGQWDTDSASVHHRVRLIRHVQAIEVIPAVVGL
jgi:hypothetical protein